MEIGVVWKLVANMFVRLHEALKVKEQAGWQVNFDPSRKKQQAPAKSRNLGANDLGST